MLFFRSLRIATLLILMCGDMGLGQETGQSENQPMEEEILVTATRSAEPVETSSASATIFSTGDLEASPSLAVDELLRTAPGFSLFRRSSSLVAHPTAQGVSLRGVGPSGVSRTLVLLDGVPLNDPFGGWVTWGRVSVSGLERVEIVRGGGSSVWGSSALGGVIQLFSVRPARFSVGAQLEAGERSTRLGDVMVTSGAGPWMLAGHVNVLDYGGYQQISAEQRGAIDVPTDSRHWQADGRVGWSVTDSTRLEARLEHFDEQRSNGTPLTDNSTALDLLVVNAEIATDDFGSWTFRSHFQDQEFAARFSAQAPDRSSERPALDQFLVAARRLGLSAVWRNRLSAGPRSHSLVAGVDGTKTDGETNERFFFSGGDFVRQRAAGGEEELLGAFVQDSVSFGDRLELQIGVRFDQWQGIDGFRREFNRSDGSVRLQQAFADRTQDAVSPRVGLSFGLSPRWRLKSAAYGAFRSPTINELYRPFRIGNDITAANAALVSEKLVGAEIGLDGGGNRWQLATTAFYNQLNDPIANVTVGFGPGLVDPCGFTPSGGSCRQRQNLDRTIVWGGEAELRLHSVRNRIDLGYQFSHAEVDRAANAPALEGLRLAQVPRNSASIRVDSTLTPKWFGEVEGRYAGRQFEDDLNRTPLDGYFLVHLGTRVIVNPSVTVFVRAENVLGREVEVRRNSNGLLTLGAPRTLRAGLRFRL